MGPRSPGPHYPAVPAPLYSPFPTRDPEGIGTELDRQRAIPSSSPLDCQLRTLHHAPTSHICEVDRARNGDSSPTPCQRRKRGRATRKSTSCILPTDLGPSAHRIPGPTNSSLTHPITSAGDVFTGSDVAAVADVTALLQEAADAARSDFDESSALGLAKGYTFPPHYLRSDRACLRAAQLDFVSMVRRRLKILSSQRLNPQRVGKLRPDNPEIQLLLELSNGMHVPLPPGFIPNGREKPSPLRETYVAVAPAVNRMLGDIVEQRLAFLLSYDDAVQYVPNLHLCKAHWTKKKGKASGRPLEDLTYVDGTPVNTPAMSDAAAAHYGAILHPTIEDIAVMICDFWSKTLALDPTANWTLLRIWKMGLKEAYTLLSFRPEDVELFAMMLMDGIVYLQIAGIFGWAGTPAAFQVITRAIKWELNHALQSSVTMYVDDVIGVCLLKDLQNDLALTRDICTSLLGPSSVADDKTETGQRLDVIGYVIDLDTERVAISRKNYLNTLHGFAAIDIDAAMSLRTAQKLASRRGSRYGKICRVMRLSAPGMWVVWVTCTSAATHRRVQIIAALVAMDPRGLSVMAQVRAVTLSPLRAILQPAFPKAMCPNTARIAPMNSDSFWNEESELNPRQVRSMVQTPLATSVPLVLS